MVLENHGETAPTDSSGDLTEGRWWGSLKSSVSLEVQ